MTEAEIQREIAAIKERNRRVEADKAWEVCWTRRLFIAVATYVTAGVWLVTINDINPWLKALVPTVGYLFSTFSLPSIKRWWLKRRTPQHSNILKKVRMLW